MEHRQAMGEAPNIPPSDLAAESAILGAIVLEGPEALRRVAATLQPTDFYTDANRAVYGAMLALHGRGEPVDPVTLREELRRTDQLDVAGGPFALALLMEDASVLPHLPAYVAIVREKAVLREVVQTASALTEAAFQAKDDVIKIVSTAETNLSALRARLVDGWPEPEPIPARLLPVPPLEPKMLPKALASWVTDIAERTQCPPDFVAVGALVAAAAVVGRKVGIRPKRQDDWLVVPNLWGLVVGRSGIMKSPALAEALKPLNRLTVDAHIEYEQKMEQHSFVIAEQNAHRKAFEKRLAEAVANEESTGDLRRLFETPKRSAPTERRYMVNDSTVEKLGELLNENPNGLLLYRDELSGFLATLDREGHENDRAFYCEAWNGTGSYTYDRIGRGTIHVKAACVSLLGGIQPGPLRHYLLEAFGQGAADDGLIQRFQLAVYPDVGGAWQNVDRWPNTQAKTVASDTYQRLAALDPAEVGADVPSPEELPFLRFSHSAQGLFDEWRSALEAKLRSEDEHPAVITHLAKYRGLMPALALIVHLIECVTEGTPGPVSADAAATAIAWCGYLEAHARRIYQTVTGGAQGTAQRLANRLQEGKLDSPFTLRDIRRKEWAGLADGDLLPALGMLEDLHWLRSEQVPPTERGGRGTVRYHVNPLVLKECSQRD